MYTATWCPDCTRAKQFLAAHGLAFEEINIEKTEGAAEFVIAANHGKRRVPTFEIDGRTFYCSPYDPEKLKRELKLD
ncbi:MAG: glutaredoxin family protein [Terriglobia bacterium]